MNRPPRGPTRASRVKTALINRFSGKIAVTLLDQGGVSVVNFASFFLLARAMDGAHLGHFALGYTAILTLTALQQSLLGTAYQVKGARRSGRGLRQFTTVTFALQGGVALCVSVLATMFAGLFALAGKDGTALFILVLGLSAAPWMTQDLMRKSFYTLERYRSALFNNFACYGLQLAGVLWLVSGDVPPEGWKAVAVYGGSSAIAALLGFAQLRDLFVTRMFTSPKRIAVVARDIWSFSKWLSGAELWRQLSGTANTWLIPLLMGPAALGAYRAATHLVNVFNPVETAIGLWLPSQASRRFARDGAASLQSWIWKLAPLVVAPFLAGAAVFALFSGTILEAAYPGRFVGLGLGWVVAATAFSRVLGVARGVFHTGLIASNRADTSLPDSLIHTGFKYVIGVPAIASLGLVGAPFGRLASDGATLLYNLRMFRRLKDLAAPRPTSRYWREIGAGQEGTVYHDERAGVVSKIYLSERHRHEALEYKEALTRAANRPNMARVGTPRPVSFEPEIPMITMEAVSGISLGHALLARPVRGTRASDLYDRIWEGIATIPESIGVPSYDLWPLNILWDREADRLTFIDILPGEDSVYAPGASLAAHTLGGVLGGIMYDLCRPMTLARPGYRMSMRRLARNLIGRAEEAGESRVEIAYIAREYFWVRAGPGSVPRWLWYRTLGQCLFSLNRRWIFGRSSRTMPDCPASAPSSPPEMRVCHYISQYPYDSVRAANGVREAVRGMAVGMAEAGIDVHIVTEGELRERWYTEGRVPVQVFRRRLARIAGLVHPESLRWHIRNTPIDTLFVVHGQFSPRAARFANLLTREGRPYVLVPHSLYSQDVFRKNAWVKRLYWHAVEKTVLRRAKLIHLMGPGQDAPLRRLGIQTPVCIIPNATDPAKDLPEEALTWRSTGPVRLYCLTRINFHQKAMDLMVRALSVVAQDHDVTLTIQGPDGGDLSALRDMIAELDVADITTILEPDFELDAARLIAPYDVFCMPSRIEGFPIAALDAMQAGRPLLFTNVSGLTGAVAESGCGVVVSPDVEDVIRGLRALMERRSEFRAMGLAGREYVRRHYSRAAVASTMTRFYSQVTPLAHESPDWPRRAGDRASRGASASGKAPSGRRARDPQTP